VTDRLCEEDKVCVLCNKTIGPCGEVERLRGSHNTMTVDCQIQGCREKSYHELLDKQEAEVEQWRANYQIMLEANEENVKLVERLQGHMEWEIAVRDKLLVEEDATIATLEGRIKELETLLEQSRAH